MRQKGLSYFCHIGEYMYLPVERYTLVKKGHFMSYTYPISLSHEPEIGAPMCRKGDKMLYKDQM